MPSKETKELLNKINKVKHMNEKIDLVSLPKESFWKLSIPIIGFCIFDAIYGIVDMVWVSKISVEAFFALGVSIPFVSLIFSFGDSIGQGTNSIMSRFIGSGDYESAYNSLLHGVILSNIIWIAIVFCLLFAEGILFYLDKSDSYILVFDYLAPIVIFAYIFILVNLLSETMQAEGNSRTPTILMISTSILNIILDPILIFNLNLGLRGAAYATVLSSLPAIIIIMYLYLSGRTKVPFSPKYFKFRPYILVEIFKVALPNFLDNGLWAFSASFINSMLIITTGEIGPILYSVSNKLKTLLIAPVKGYGRGLMSVTGHLFGAGKFDELEKMFKYVLKISAITTLIVMIAFIFLRDYAFGLFSITGMDKEVFRIAIGGTVIMLSIPFSMISSKMLDGFGKSLYSLLFTVIKILIEMILIYELAIIISDGTCVLIGIMISEIVMAIVYYLFLKHLFKNFDKDYGEKGTVKSFKDGEDGGIMEYLDDGIEEDGEKKTYKILLRKVPLALALVSMGYVLLKILLIPIQTNNFHMLTSGLFALVGSSIGILLMEKYDKPLLSVLGFIIVAVVLFIFMDQSNPIATILFVTTGTLILLIKVIFKRLKYL